MNRAYKLVWNATQQAWVVAGELAKGRKKSAAKGISLMAVLAGSLVAGQAHAASGAAIVLPSGESVAFGSATFDRGTPLKLTVNQTSNKLITNWNSFDVGSAATVQFVQPNTNSVVLNRVTSGSPTEIAGKVSANGQFILVNPNGVLFSAGSQVSASSITASTLQIENTSVAAGSYVFNRGSATGTVENRGTLTASAGSVSLLAPSIKNSGSMSANGGNVALLSATQVSAGAITQASSIAGSIQQSGTVQATQVSSNGGRILITGDKSQTSSRVTLGGSLTAATTIDVSGKAIDVTSALALNGSSNLDADGSIVFGADTTVATDKALNLTHGVGAGKGYSLDHAAKVNLSGAGAGFSVNGESYTVVQDLAQLQNIYTALDGKYVVATDINGNGADFEPIGPYNDVQGEIGPFTGTFDGLGHVISNLRMVQSGYNDMGLFGATKNATLRNIGLEGLELAARNNIGALVGTMVGGSISNSYARNSTIGLSSFNGGYSLGGLVGVNYTGSINNSYADVTITAPVGESWSTGNYLNIGGLVGTNEQGSINNTYASSSITSYDLYNHTRLGGLVGENSGSISNSYASGFINNQTGQPDTVKGGLVGVNEGPVWFPSPGTVTNSYWNPDTTFTNFSAGGTALYTSQLTTASNFNGWSIDAEGGTGSVWRIYEGSTSPLLRSFLKQTWATTTNNSKTYDGTTAISSSHTQSDPSAILQGSAVYVTDSANAGNQAINIRGLYSNQQGYDLIVNKGIASIAKRDVTITSTDASKVYDGGTAANSTAVLLSGTFVDDQYITHAVFDYADKNAGTGKSLVLSSVSINDGNNKGGNYNVIYTANTNSSIAKRQLTISSVTDSKEYDGKLTSMAKPEVIGRQRGDSISGLSQYFASKNAGADIRLVVDGGYVIRDGNGGNNYDVTVVSNAKSSITPKALIISTIANSKAYDGGVTSANKPLVTGLVAGDTVSGLFQQYESKTVGDSKKLLIKSGYVLRDGNGGANYAVTEQGSNDGVITAH